MGGRVEHHGALGRGHRRDAEPRRRESLGAGLRVDGHAGLRDNDGDQSGNRQHPQQ